MATNFNRRTLARGTPQESSARAVNCLACEWRKPSQAGLKALVERFPENRGLSRYTGFLHGVQDGFLVTAQFLNGRQVGLVTVPLGDVEGWMDSIIDYLNDFMDAVNAVAKAAAQPLEDDEDDFEANEEGEDGEETEGE